MPWTSGEVGLNVFKNLNQHTHLYKVKAIIIAANSIAYCLLRLNWWKW